MTANSKWQIKPLVGTRELILSQIAHALNSQSTYLPPDLEELGKLVPGIIGKSINTTDGDNIIWSIWHSGADYEIYAFGDTQLLDYSSQTENEREYMVLASREASSLGKRMYIVGNCVSKNQRSDLDNYRLTITGILFFDASA